MKTQSLVPTLLLLYVYLKLYVIVFYLLKLDIIQDHILPGINNSKVNTRTCITINICHLTNIDIV